MTVWIGWRRGSRCIPVLDMGVAPERRRSRRSPAWIKTKATMGPEYRELQSLVKREGLPRSARRPAVPTSSSAGKTARPRSSSAATTAPAAATSASSTPASPTTSTATSPAASPSRSRPWGCATPPSPASPATTSPTKAPGCTPRPSARSTGSTRTPDVDGPLGVALSGLCRPLRPGAATALRQPLSRVAHPQVQIAPHSMRFSCTDQAHRYSFDAGVPPARVCRRRQRCVGQEA